MGLICVSSFRLRVILVTALIEGVDWPDIYKLLFQPSRTPACVLSVFCCVHNDRQQRDEKLELNENLKLRQMFQSIREEDGVGKSEGCLGSHSYILKGLSNNM